MKRLLSSVGLFALMVLPLAAQEATDSLPSPEAVSRALGVSFGEALKQNVKRFPMGETIKMDLVLQGLNAYVNGTDTTLMPEAANEMVMHYFKAMTERQNELTKEESQAFLKENASKEDVHRTASGLQYQILSLGKGPKPTVEDTVVVHYKGMLVDGTVFDSSYQRGEPARFSPLQVIPGWTEGLCLLPEGSKARLVIPYTLAYGAQGAGRTIPPYATLIFDIELVQVIKGKPIPAAESAPVQAPEQQTDEKE